MIQTEFKELVFSFARESSYPDVAQVILFGSVAQGTADNRSDVDMLVVLDTEREDFEGTDTRDKVSSAALTLGKEYDRNIQLVFTNRLFSGVDAYLVEKALSEGIILYSKTPRIHMNGKVLEQFLLIMYNTNNLDHNNRQKLSRELYGYRTNKEVKGRFYKTEKEGVVKTLEGRKLSSNIFIIPSGRESEVKKIFQKLHVAYTKADIWISEDGRINLLGKGNNG